MTYLKLLWKRLFKEPQPPILVIVPEGWMLVEVNGEALRGEHERGGDYDTKAMSDRPKICGGCGFALPQPK